MLLNKIFSFGKAEDPPLTIKDKLKYFFIAYWRGIVCVLTPLIALPIILPPPIENYQWCAFCLVIMAIYWVTECIPLTVTSFLPLIIFPLTGVNSTTATSKAYMNDTIIMFLGSLILASAVEQSGLHKRLALCAIKLIGFTHFRLLLSLCVVTTFISMWITNTAATTMMVPINFAILKVFEDQKLLKIYETNSDGEKIASDITTCYFCAATFSATIGGIGTLVGTATNLVLKGLFQKAYPAAPEYLSFPKFSAFSVPYMIILEAAMFINLAVLYFGYLRPNSAAAKETTITPDGIAAAKRAVDADWKKLGRITFWEYMVIILFGGAMVLFFCRSPQMFEGWGDFMEKRFDRPHKFIRDSALAALVSYLMLLAPSSLYFFKNFIAKYHENFPKSPVQSVLNWSEMNAKLPYSFMFLLGGGFALSDAAKKTGLNEKIGESLQSLKSLPNAAIILIIIIVVIFVTNFASNVVVCNVFVPIVMELAKKIDRNPLWYAIAAGFSASYCFMIPVGTPGNLIVQSAASIPTKKMIIAGAGPTLSTIIITWAAIYFWAPVIWSDLLILPDWAHAQTT
ncbi:unnamed protein product [Parnassius mnemosyne]|uniref:Solute carrier family 13 member 3 n=1 Tax=Parnassius mnemosyne TaxID=213953 RepID=A0AAV1LKT3_9NEOP